MLRNYIKTAIRNILRNPFFSFLNILGLALSLSVCLLVIAIVKDQFEYDSNVKDKEQIFRITSKITQKNYESEHYATSPVPLSDHLLLDNDIVEKSASVRPISALATANDKRLPITGAFTSSDLFLIFNFHTERGEDQSLLSQPNTVILSKEIAVNLFGDEDPLNQTISLDSIGSFKVIGVLKEPHIKTNVKYDMFISDKSVSSLEKQHKLDSISNDWAAYFSAYTYLKVKPEISIAVLDKRLNTLSREIYKTSNFKFGERSLVFEAQRLSSITPGKDLLLENSNGMSYKVIMGICGAVLLLLILSCFNYTNLTIARAFTRAKEIGVRKVIGASRRHIFGQFIVESTIIAFGALILGSIIIPYIPLNSQLQSLISSTHVDLTLIIWSLLFVFFVGIMAGALPGITLSNLSPISILQKLERIRAFKISSLRKILTVIQFAVAFVLIMTFVVLYRQTKYMADADYGFTTKNIINIKLNKDIKFDVLKNELNKYPLWTVSGISDVFGSYPSGESTARINKSNEPLTLVYYYTDENVIQNFNLKLLAGKNFEAGYQDKRKDQIIVNERAVRAFNLSNPASAVGRQVWLNDSTSAEIIGVLKDFNFQSFKNPIEPMAFIFDQAEFKYLNLKVKESQISSISGVLEKISRNLHLRSTLQYSIFEEDFMRHQLHAKEVSMIGFITVMFLTIAALGLLGIASYTMQVKMKDICIRKVLGATKLTILKNLVSEYIILISLACLIGIPIGLFVSYSILESYVYRIHIGLWTLIIPILSIFLIGTLTFGIQTVKAMLISPVKNLSRE